MNLRQVNRFERKFTETWNKEKKLKRFRNYKKFTNYKSS